MQSVHYKVSEESRNRNMAASNATYNIEKLADTNYESWKIQMRSVLIVNDLWGFVSGETVSTQQNEAEWKTKDGKALALITLSTSKNQLTHIKKAKTSNEAWLELERVHESKGPVRKAVLYKQLYRMKKDASQSMTQYVHFFTRKAEQLEEVGIKIPNELLSVMLLSSLPSEYDSFCVAIESRDQVPDIESLKLKLIEQEARLNERNSKYDENQIDALLVKGKGNNKTALKEHHAKQKFHKFQGSCYKCGKVGHRAIDCRVKKTSVPENKAEDAMQAIVLNAEPENSAQWCLDSGATRHMCNNREKFSTFSKDKACKVYTAAEHCVKSEGAGDIKMKVRLSRNTLNNIKLRDAILVPGFRNNLLSVSRMTDNNYTVIFRKESALVKRPDGSVALTAKRRGQLYLVDSGNEESAFNSEEHTSKKLQRWHNRFGHLNLNDLKKLKTEDMVSGIDFNPNEAQFNCEVCHMGKICQIPFGKSSNRAKDKLGLVHSDICGPMSTTSIGGSKYFVTFIDDYSRYTEIVMLKNRSEVLSAFRKFMLRVKRECGYGIKILRTDNAKEYISKEFSRLLESEGIKHELTVPHTPQQNGVAERANRTLVEMARCMLLQSKLPMSLWAEAINTANFIRNRCPTKALDNKTPFEMWSDRKPYVGFMRTFGCKAISLIKGTNRRKFEAKGKPMIMVGYSSESKAYRLWQPGSKTIIKSRDVRFLEDTQPNSNRAVELFEAPMNLNEESIDSYNDPETESIEEKEEIYDTPNDEIEIVDRHITKLEEICETPRGNSNEDDNIHEEVPSTSMDDMRNESEVKRGRGRPKKIKTGKPGRPKRLFQEAANYSVGEYEDPTNVEDMLSREDRKL